MFEALAKWSHGRLLWTLALSYVAILDGMSWLTSRGPLCVVEAPQNGCPTLHTFLVASVDSILEAIGHEWIIAISAVATAIFTGTLWYSTKRLWEASERQFQLARTEFLSSHRPKMRLKHMWLIDQIAWRRGGPFEVNLDIVNVGNTSGFITWINFDTIILPPGRRLPQRPPYDEFSGDPDLRTTRFRTNAELLSGVTLFRHVSDGQILDDDGVREILWGEKQLYLFGTIEYVNFTGIRQTGFCRRFTYESYPPSQDDFGRFEIHKDHDYEFED